MEMFQIGLLFLLFIFLINFILFIYFWERPRQHEQGRDRQREGDREPQAGPMVSAQSPTQGSNSQNREITTWDETKSWTLNRLSHPRAPKIGLLKNMKRYRIKEREVF